jgi:hypothetical protein
MVERQRFGSYCQPSASGSSRTSSASIGGNRIKPWSGDTSSGTTTLILARGDTSSGAQAAARTADKEGSMRDNVDYRLLERFRTYKRANLQPPAPAVEQKRAAAAAHQHRLPALELRD